MRKTSNKCNGGHSETPETNEGGINAMSEKYLSAAWDELVADATEEHDKRVVSLYVEAPYFGGPEEGGWWGHDFQLVEHVVCPSAAMAETLRARVERRADTMTDEAKTAWSKHCQRELDDAERRGIDPSDLPETDGHDAYHVMVESYAGENASTGSRQWQ